MKMSDICTTSFFQTVYATLSSLGYADKEPLGNEFMNFFNSNQEELHYDILFNYNFPVSETYELNEIAVLSRFFAFKYHRSLYRVYVALFTDYGVFDNTDVTTNEEKFTDIVDTMVHGKISSHLGTDSSTKTGEDKYTDDITSESTSNSFTTYDNTEDYKPTSRTEHRLKSGGKTEYGNALTDIYNSRTENSGSDRRHNDEDEERNVHRKGNIGITSNQKMGTDEMILRVHNNMHKYVISMLVETFSKGIWE